MEWTRLENESEEHLLMRLVAQKEQIGTWDDIAKIMNDLTGQNYGECKYRKSYKSFQKMYDANLDTLTDFGNYSESVAEQKRDLEKAKIQFRDERTAWNKQNYINARIEKDLDYLGEKLQEIGKVNFNVQQSPITIAHTSSENDLIVCMSDLHIGATFDNFFGSYNSDIAKDRLNIYLDKVIEIGKRHNVENIYIELLGDQISGGLHPSIKVSDRENVIDQVKLASEYIASFCVELSQRFRHIYISGISGNHSRLCMKKEDAIKDERLDDLITWIVEQMTKHIVNIDVFPNHIDTGISYTCVRNKTYLGVHGDSDYMTDAGISRLVTTIGEIPYAILGGHRHTPAYKEFNNIKYIQSGSLCSTGDDYTISKRLYGKANQTILVCNNKGIECIYNVELS